jgi:rhamnosyl/mannosyltransferase
LSKAHAITTTSHRLLSSSNILKLYKDKTKIIPLSSEEKFLKITYESDYFLIIGRLSHYKGLNVLISSIKAGLKINRKIMIVGKGEPKIENEIKKLKGQAKLEFINEFVSEKTKNKLIENCYALVFPSTLNSEAFGITQIEAMSYGKPIINTNLDTAVPWVSVHDLTGYTVKPNDSVELSQAINKLDKLSKKKYVQFCKNSYFRFQTKFSNRIAQNDLLNLFKEIS